MAISKIRLDGFEAKKAGGLVLNWDSYKRNSHLKYPHSIVFIVFFFSPQRQK